jgi:hypothetical protein
MNIVYVCNFFNFFLQIYSGDADGRVPVIGTRYCVEAFGLPLKSTWRTWYHHNQVLYAIPCNNVLSLLENEHKN